jgi:hypothetical protein
MVHPTIQLITNKIIPNLRQLLSKLPRNIPPNLMPNHPPLKLRFHQTLPKII